MRQELYKKLLQSQQFYDRLKLKWKGVLLWSLEESSRRIIRTSMH